MTEMMLGLAWTGIILSAHRGDQAKEKAYSDKFKMALEPEDIAPVNRW